MPEVSPEREETELLAVRVHLLPESSVSFTFPSLKIAPLNVLLFKLKLSEEMLSTVMLPSRA